MNRLDELYQMLMHRGDVWISLMEFYELMRCYPDWDGRGEFRNCAARRQISADIQAINADERYEKIIIHGNRGVKLATEEEARRYLGNQLGEALRHLNRVRAMQKKAGADGQMTVFGNEIISFIEKGLKEV